MKKARLPFGMKLLVVFFSLPAAMIALTAVVLVWPGTFLDRVWHLNPEAHPLSNRSAPHRP